MEYKELLAKRYTVKTAELLKSYETLEKEDLLKISFDETEEILSIIASPDCCDINWLELSSDRLLDSLVGCKIISIDEGEGVGAGKVEYEYILQFPVTITYEDDDGETHTISFVRKNLSNGYYAGYLWISSTNLNKNRDD